MVIQQYTAVCFATLCVALSRDFAVASLIRNLFYTWQTFACGFFIAVERLPVYLKWTTYVFYAFGALSTNGFANQHYDCPLPGGESNPGCLQYSEIFQLKASRLPPNWLWQPILAMLEFLALIIITSWIALSILRQEMRLANAQQEDADISAGKKRMMTSPTEAIRSITIRLENCGLNVQTSSFRRWRWKSKILNTQLVNYIFIPATLNVVMGPSGSGKTSLLTSLAQQLKHDLSSQYVMEGKVFFKGGEPSKAVLQSLVSFMTQDDAALLPSLTVRETPRFAAGLRLPKWMSKTDKHRRAEEVLLKLGLKDRANHSIGSNLVKGISGGGKRRVAIAIQILTDPRVQLLDESTSGLNGFTAVSIMEVLKSLANEGRTLIMTVHQSGSDLWQSFGNVLLLARGGYPVYARPREHAQTFRKQRV
ncbi:hypothetical protein FKW77_005007 [Venturia effusa]|uniref:ABC transporter domain-containing protein n=1 Tax=Venturia effusa TaxID=50376 RepID=A0A517LR85_9PEZI|nr:hypothetical protein FKW77_005007 [Venturia effusa]